MLWTLGAVALLIALSVVGVLWMTAVPGRSHAGPLPPLTPDQAQLASRLQEHVRAIASRPHNVSHPQELERAALYIEGALAGMGYAVHPQPFRADGQEVRNIEVVIEPAPSVADASTLVVGAHYDSYLHAPGANDNGTGVAGVIELARLLADLRRRSSIRIRLALFVNEEPPYFKTERMGSLVYAKRLKQSGEPVLGMLSLETLGWYSDAAHSPLSAAFGPALSDDGRFRGLRGPDVLACARTPNGGVVPIPGSVPERRGDRAGDHPGHRLVGSLGL